MRLWLVSSVGWDTEIKIVRAPSAEDARKLSACFSDARLVELTPGDAPGVVFEYYHDGPSSE